MTRMARLGFGSLAIAVASTLVIGASATAPFAASAAADWVAELNRLAQFVPYPQPPDALRTIAAADMDAPAVRALRAALLYRTDPMKWASDLAASFAIHDYAARARGETHDISQEEFVSRIKKVESSYPSLSPQIMMLAAFIELRDANLWFAQGDQKVSVARFLRGAFLAHVFKGTSLDAVVVANQLDQDAQKAYQRTTKGSK